MNTNFNQNIEIVFEEMRKNPTLFKEVISKLSNILEIRVKLHNLSNKEYNGKNGKIISGIDCKNRYQIQIDDSQKIISIHKSKLLYI
jgi:hypothetical protein